MIGTIIGATVAGVLIGQLSAGIPLGIRLNRAENPQPTPQPVAEDKPSPVDGDPLLYPWPADKAVDMIAAWRDQTMPQESSTGGR